MIINSASRWAGGRWVGWLVVRGFNKTQKKNLFVGSDFVYALWLRFCYSNFYFYYIDDKEKTNLISRSSHSNL